MTFANEKLVSWTPGYWNHIQRNIGVVSYLEQELIRTSRIAVLGVGGIGGSLAENLVRAGCQNLVICDFDTFDETNLNRQICTLEDMGRYKVDVLEEFLLKIDPDVQIEKIIELDDSNIVSALEGVKVVTLTLDDPITSILIARECRKRNIPMIEAWAVPLLYTMWFTSESMDFETFYNLSTHNLSIDELKSKKEEFTLYSYNSFIPRIFDMPGVREKYQRDMGAYKAMMEGSIGLRSFAPVVRITADFLALDVIFSGILRIKPMNLAPYVKGLDYIQMELHE